MYVYAIILYCKVYLVMYSFKGRQGENNHKKQVFFVPCDV